MSGIRLYHPKARAGMFTFEHNQRPYRRWNQVLKRHEAIPLLCVACGKAHAVKTYHVNVDSTGHAIVSHEVWSFMQRYSTAGFQLANEVEHPPPLLVGLGGAPITPIPLEE
jgi:hypothetical protein